MRRLGGVFEEIDRSGWLELLAELVRTPSHPGVERQEEAVVEALSRYLAGHGIESQCVEVSAGRPNLLATLRAGAPGRRLLLCGHTDTVALNAGAPGTGFSAEIRDGMMFGRGAADMKGALAAMAAALVALHRSGMLSGGELTLAAVIDEEMESLGAEHLVKSGLSAEGAIVGEPTGNRLHLGHRGLEWLEIVFTGRPAHGGTPDVGVNAIVAASRFVGLVETDLIPALESRSHPLLGPPTINFGTIRGGDQPSTVAATCVVTLDRRSVPGESFGSIVSELRELLSRVESEMAGLRSAVRRMPGGMATLEHLSMAVSLEDPLVATVRGACEEIKNTPEEGGVFPAWSDAALLSNFAGIPCVVLGPGDLAIAHTPFEFIPLEQVTEAARIYAASAIAFCGG